MRSDKRAGGVDVEIFVEIREFEREGIMGRVGGYGSALTGFQREEIDPGSE